MKRMICIAIFLLAIAECLSSVLFAQQLDILSGTSLKLTIRHNDAEIGYGTGFVVQKDQRYYLITNRHIVLGCSEDKNPDNVGGWLCANNLVILHNRLNHVGEWVPVVERLYRDANDKEKLWLEHPSIGRVPGSSVDLVALPLTQTNDINFLPLDLGLRNTDMAVSVGEGVSIVGFPFGSAQGGGLAIWKTGTIASDVIVNFESKAKFLVDTTARPGMSGSPVYARRYGAFQSSTGAAKIVSGGSATKFLGVFAEESPAAEIGIVWKAEANRGECCIRLFDDDG
jgi:hypothetical protein